MRDAPLKLSWAPGRADGTAILKAAGPITLANLFVFQEQITTAKPQVLILDLSETPYMDSAGLGAVMNCYISAQRHGRRLLVACVPDRVAALLELTKVDKVLPLFPTCEAAEESERQ